MLKNSFVFVFILVCLLTSTPSFAGGCSVEGVYFDRPSFEAVTGGGLTDPFDSGYYCSNGEVFCVLTDVEMTQKSFALTRTFFQTTHFDDWNIITEDSYCSGCNGSFLMSFHTDTTAFGFDLPAAEGGPGTGGSWVATIDCGGGNTENFLLPVVAPGDPVGFFGVVTPQIVQVHIGGAFAEPYDDGFIRIDNLTVVQAVIFSDGFESGDTSRWSAVVGQ